MKFPNAKKELLFLAVVVERLCTLTQNKRVKREEQINYSAELFKALAVWLKTNWEF